ncbi:interleukin-1 beta-like [Xiphophorus couchianus]|uniref:interleukin-1 beta-like n=1 Tax=Xiphophorus couchianus TaxID=32473 RepID=UPI001016066D|nr:interleukin-1 beta-like [Xiphophorus couchianus]XP_027890634.1 interleukin-1 beta-like [Xiphophorus couchianus]XP_027890635.1 interleukin-1 beta-like [Xiphophorus couchianus]
MESKKNCSISQMWTKKMPKGVDLEISHQPPSMRCVANLIIAMERLKAGMSESVLSPDFSDEERFIFERTSAGPGQFSRREEHPCSVTDGQKRSLVLVRNNMELLAVMLQGGNDSRKVYLNMATYVHLTPDTGLGQPVVLGIRDTDFYLSCHKDGDKPTLHLEEVEDKASLSEISVESDMRRFLFYKRDMAVNISTLMSALFPNWYISTATDNNRPVAMCQESASRYRTFSIQRQS